MKLNLLFLVIAVILFQANAYLEDKDFTEKLLTMSRIWHNKCMLITGATQDMIDQMKIGNFIDDERIQRYTFCLWIVSDVMSTDDFHLDHEVLKDYIPTMIKNGRDIYKRCENEAKKSGETEGYKITWNMMKCIQKANPDTFIMF